MWKKSETFPLQQAGKEQQALYFVRTYVFTRPHFTAANVKHNSAGTVTHSAAGKRTPVLSFRARFFSGERGSEGSLRERMRTRKRGTYVHMEEKEGMTEGRRKMGQISN